MFEGEVWGLRAMHATATLRVPRPLHAGPLAAPGGGSFLVMEHLELGALADQSGLGRQLALRDRVEDHRGGQGLAGKVRQRQFKPHAFADGAGLKTPACLSSRLLGHDASCL